MVKIVVFDFDDTLYNTDVWAKWPLFCRESIRECLPDYDNEQIEEFINKYKLFRKCDGNRVAEALIKETGNNHPWGILRDGLYDKAKCVTFADGEIIQNFANFFDLYIVSYSTIDFIKSYSKKHNFDLSNFKEIIGNNELQCFSNKKEILQKIIADKKINANELVVVGDNYYRDILPANKLGATGILVKKVSEINKELLDKIIKIK